MLEEFRRTTLIWDRASRKTHESIRISESDNGGRSLFVTVLNGNRIENLSGASLSLFWETKDKAYKGLDAFTAVDATKGEFEIYYTTGMLSNEGTLNANLVLVDANGRIVSEPFTITVFKGIDDDAIQSDNSFTALTIALAKVGNIDSVVANMATKKELQQVSLAYKESYATVALLQAAYPNGDSFNHVVLSDNMIYTYKNGWLSTGVQANGTGVADGSVTPEKTTFLTYGINKLNPEKMTDGYSVNSIGTLSADALFSTGEFIPVKKDVDYIIYPNETTLKRPALYDFSKTFIRTLITQTTTGILSFKPTMDGYLRLSVLTTGKEKVSVTMQADSASFVPFYLAGSSNLKTKPLENSVGKKEIVDGSVGYEQTDFLIPSVNLFDKNSPNIEFDKVVGSSAINTLYDTSDYIRLYDGENYTISHPVKIETSNIVKGEREWSALLGSTPHTFTATRDGFLKVSYLKTHRDRLQVQVGNVKTEYEPFGTFKMPKLIVPKPIEVTKRLLGFGDSINQGGGNVVNGKGYGHIEMIAEDNNMTYHNYSVGGSTVAPREGYDNQIIKQINEAITNGDTADFIVFNGLTNDASATPIDRIGEMTPGYTDTLDLNTFAGSFEEICRTLKLNWLGARIIYIRVHNMNSRGTQQVSYGEMAVKICKKYSIPVVDMYKEGGLNTQIEEMRNLYTNNADGTHPNALGYRTYYVPEVVAKMLI